MNNTNTGGPAFANQLECNRDGYAVTGGMTLRDYFAAKAMQSYLADRAWQAEIPHSETARVAYIVADAMLKARQA
jgi:hypothetical protein